MKLKKFSFGNSELLVALIISYFVAAYSSLVESRECGTLQSKRFPGQKLILQEGGMVGNLDQEYATAKETWKVDGTWTVSSGCELEVCTNPYLSRGCKKLTATATNSSSSGYWLSEVYTTDSEEYFPESFEEQQDEPVRPSFSLPEDSVYQDEDYDEEEAEFAERLFVDLASTTTAPTPDALLSARCTCARNCNCSSAVTHFGKFVCALAYFHPKGCHVCNAPYTELEHSGGTFPEKWSNTLRSFLVRPGCTLTLYEDEDYEEETDTLVGPFVEDWSGRTGSYTCLCHPVVLDQTEEKPFGKDDRNYYAPQVEVPKSMDRVVSMIRDHNYTHPGLLAAFSSLNNGRSSNNAYILMIGSSGAGKSSLINNLLGKPNITLEGGKKSTTSKIHEFRIPVPLAHLGVNNTELRIIDTPGLGDTRGAQHDARFLATLDDYLSQHEDLKHRIPNLILVLHHFTDNRFHGEGAKFVSMIRGLDCFRTRITDENYSNVMFVFSHLCSATTKEKENPASILLNFKQVIEEFTLFPKPILTAVVENRARDNELLMINGNYELPNKELFPRNLLKRFDSITLKGNDTMGQAIIAKAFEQTSHADLNVTESRFELVSLSHGKVPNYLSILQAATRNIASTEVSQMLSEAFVKMKTMLKVLYPNSLEYLQKYMYIRNFRTQEDIPRTTSTILELLEGMERNPGNMDLIEKGLDLKPRTCPENMVAGYGYNILNDAVLPTVPFTLDQPYLSTISYTLRNSVSCTKNTVPVMEAIDKLEIFKTKKDYIQQQIENFRVNISLIKDVDIFTGLKSKVKEGFYVKDLACSNNNICSFVATRTFKLFQFDLNEDAIFTPTFTQLTQKLPAFNKSNYENVKSWKDFFEEYGTHVVKSAYGGGRIDIRISGPSFPPESMRDSIFNVVQFAEDLSQLITGEKIDPRNVLPVNISHSLIFRGGSSSYHTSDLTKLPLEKSSELLKKWKKSLHYNPVVYPLDIVPLSEVTKRLGQGISEKIHEASLLLLNSSLKYVQPPPPPTPDPKVVLEEVRQKSEKQIRELQEEIKRLKEKMEKERKAFDAAEIQRDREAREREKRRRQELAALVKSLEEEQRRFKRRFNKG